MDKIDMLIQYINESNNIVFFGGAGVSTESGVPDFRSKDGLYNQHDIRFDMYDPEYLLSRDCLYNNPKVFYEFYRQKMDTRNIEPNITHKVLVKLEAMGKLNAVITQNIDGLHQKAGSKNVYEIHGTTLKNHCDCKEYDENYIFDSDEAIPKCPYCRKLIRPNVVLYGESLPEEAVNYSLDALHKADMLIIGGTSLQVYPAANFIYEFRGKHMVVINKEELKAQLNDKTDLVFKDSLGDVFREIDERLNYDFKK